MFGGLLEFFTSPKVALIVFTLFLVGYIVFIDEEGGFTKSFLHFGPGISDDTTTKFMGIKLDSWHKVILLYFVSFFSALLTAYYDTIMKNQLHSYLWNHAIRRVPFSKSWTYAIVLMEPFFFQVLAIVQFFTSMTMQLQFIVPQFLGDFIASVPFTLQRMGDKRFDEL